MALTLEEYQEMAQLAQELGDVDAELEAREGIESLMSQPMLDDVPSVDESGKPVYDYEPPAQEERTALDIAQGVYETGRSAIQGAAGLPFYIAGAIEGVYKSLTDEGFSPEDAARLANEQGAIFMQAPESRTGQDIAKFMGDVGGALPPVLGVAPAAIPTLAQGRQALGGASAVASAKAFDAIDRVPQRSPITGKEKERQRIAEIIQTEPENLQAAPYDLAPQPKPQSVVEAVKQKAVPPSPIVENPFATEAIKQGFDEGVVQPIKAANTQTKKIMRDMLEMKRKGQTNRKYEIRNKPFYAVGDAIKERGIAVLNANRDAGKAIDKAAENLRGSPADALSIGRGFAESLDGIGVKLDKNNNPIFDGSDIEGNKAAENAIKNITNRMKKGGKLDAYDLHRMKRFIDSTVSYGKNAEGLEGVAENLLKGLRRDIDNQLDANYPEYDKANIAYKETRDALDTLQEVAGKKFDLTGDNANARLGNLSRRIMSNAQTAGDVMTLIDDVTNTANKYIDYKVAKDGEFLLPDLSSPKKQFKADIDMLALFSDELDNRFGASSRTSFENLSGRQARNDARRAADAMTSAGRANIAIDKAGEALEKFRGVNDENAFKAMSELLKEGSK